MCKSVSARPPPQEPPLPFQPPPPVGPALTTSATVDRPGPPWLEFLATDHTDSHQRRCRRLGPMCCHPAPRRAVDRRCPFWLEVYPALCARRHHSPKRYTKASRFQDTPGLMIAPGHRPGQIVQPPPLFWPIVHPLARGPWPLARGSGHRPIGPHPGSRGR